ncbi:arginine--tRNA ligase [Desulfuromonas acetexigens]|jgi:arginyl-tRNA synthetase|uniref:Arginine--tRNA ligase n=2 Tax=Trichloromonas acetexigens TaxID=38815 RepID=A0A550JKY5_9BACT|nr:arginine--tRNA ligase [Desulfuromonas acetexigens]
MKIMKEQIQLLLEEALTALKGKGLLPTDLEPAIQIDRTKDKAHGDLATNLAMIGAKAAKKNPRQLAAEIIEHLPPSKLVRQVEIAGPGFINFYLNPDWLAEQLENALADPRLAIPLAAPPQTVVVDYSSPNLAKEMHVGHLRSTIIGDAVSRTLEFLGHKVIRHNHVGDWGTQFGMLLAHMEELQGEGSAIRMQLADLESFYREAKGRFDASPVFADRARQLVVELQSGDAHCNRLWREFLDISLSHCQQIYDRLNVALTRADVRGESAYNDDLAQVVEDLTAAGLLTEDQGARCVFLDEFKGKDDEPLPMIVQKKDGGYLYATTDLAAIRYRLSVLKADRLLYFVDHRQSLHFQQLFAVARQAGFAGPDTQLEHMAFGTVMGEDGKPFKTRSGGVAKLADLLDEAEARAYELVKAKNTEMSEEELRHIGRVVGIASVKYADLSKHRTSDYVFSFDQMLSFEGNTAPYLLYAYTRVASIFRRGEIDAEALQGSIRLEEEVEKELAGKLAQFSEVVQRVAERGWPHLLCAYLYDLSGIFSSFYQSCPVLNCEDAAIRASRLKLARLTARTIQQGLALLGIETLERM